MGQAAFEALGYLESVDQCSPYIDQFIERLKVLPSNETISRFQDPQWNYQVQNNKSKSAKAVGEQDLYHETNVKKTIDIAEFHTFNKQYFEATNALSTSAIGSPTCQLAEYSAQVALIQGNYSAVLNQDKRVEAFLTTSLSNELYLKRLTDQEVTSYWRVKYLILMAHFLKQEYEEAANLIYDLVDAPAIQSASGKQISALQLLKDSDFGQYIYEDEMVLVDAAGSLGGYCSDISRTWPSSGKFSPAQKELYQAVLNVEKECITNCTENHNFSLQDIHDLSVGLMKRELRNCGFGELTYSDITKLYPHYIGHNLGLDVHDVPRHSRTAKLKAGQVITIEPGVYVPDDHAFPASFRNIGIRIEDDIAVGKDTYTNLTVEAAKEIVDIERIAEVGVTTPLDDEVVEVF